MATTTNITLTSFDIDRALNGAILAFSSTGSTSGTVSDYVLNFTQRDPATVAKRYQGIVGNITYYFDKEGACSDNNKYHQLFIVEAEITTTSGTASTRAGDEGDESVDITNLQPREYFAMYALQGILTKIDNPLLLDDAKVTLISNMAFKLAQSMMNTAADYRAASSDSDSSSTIEVNSADASTFTEKVLYNISQSLEDIKDALSDTDTQTTEDAL